MRRWGSRRRWGRRGDDEEDGGNKKQGRSVFVCDNSVLAMFAMTSFSETYINAVICNQKKI